MSHQDNNNNPSDSTNRNIFDSTIKDLESTSTEGSLMTTTNSPLSVTSYRTPHLLDSTIKLNGRQGRAVYTSTAWWRRPPVSLWYKMELFKDILLCDLISVVFLCRVDDYNTFFFLQK